MAALLVGALLVACGGDSEKDDETPTAAYVRFVDATNKQQHGRRWDMLLPVQQAVVTRERFIECEDQRRRPTVKMKILEVYEEPFTVEGQRFDGTSITAEFTATVLLTESTQTGTIHAAKVDEDWRFALATETIDTYRRGQCPT